MLTQKTLHTLRRRGFSPGEISRIEQLATARCGRTGRRLDAEAVTHAACGGDPLALKLAPLVREHRPEALDPALIDACIALSERMRADMR
ncbi:MAG: hypothetical protein LDL26_09340 [Caenispirillum bisanense]|nr:hypothetical protein [Caenispirillum bisanense]MCA1973908.1 hypothetical protein [Caenispirillum sp.]